MNDGLRITALAGYELEIGRWLWALEAVRGRTLGIVQDLDQSTLDWEGADGCENAIGSLLYHIAFVEMTWLNKDILEREFPPAVRAVLSHGIGLEGRMTRVRGVPLSEHIDRLKRCRMVLLESLRSMTISEWERLRAPVGAPYRVTPAWAIFHLVEHEAGHAGQIGALAVRAARCLGG